MKSSIIIPTAGRPISIKCAIESLLAIFPEEHDAELIVVDNNTSNELSEILFTYCQTLKGRVRYVREHFPGLSAARHRGVAEARGELLTFVDDDVEVTQGWLKAIQKGFDDPAVALIGGPSIPRFTCSIPSWFWDYVQPTPYGGWTCAWLSLLDVGKNVYGIDPNYIWGLNFSIRKSVLGICGGFHPDIVPDYLQRWQGNGETGLTIKVSEFGFRADYLQDALLVHICGAERLNVEYFKKRAYFQGVCNSFTQVRKDRKPMPVPHNKVKTSLYLRVSEIMRRIRHRFNGQSHQVSPWAIESDRVRKITDQASHDGWLFHQREVASDPLLLAWVLRENYLDCNLPIQSKPDPS